MKKSYLTTILALTLLFSILTACGSKDENKQVEDTSIPVEVQTVSLGSISTENHVSGSVVSDKTETVYVSLSARCNRVYINQGDTVKAGTVLCTLDLSTFHDNYEIAEQNYQNALQSYEDQSALIDQQLTQQEKNYNDTVALFDIGSASQLEVTQAKLALDSAKINRTTTLSQLDLAVKSAKNAMDQILETLKNIDGNGNVNAPISGTVVSLGVSNNSFVSPSMPIAVIESTSDIKVSISVSESLVSKLQVGQTATVNIPALNETFDGTIQNISKTADPTNHLFTIKISIPNGTEGLLSGMFADVILYTDSRDNTVVIPTEALLQREDGQYVMTLNEDNTATLVMVTVGLIGDGMTEIIAGLSGGETLVVVGQSYLADGDLARIVSAKE